jgi:hypothetical protein
LPKVYPELAGYVYCAHSIVPIVVMAYFKTVRVLHLRYHLVPDKMEEYPRIIRRMSYKSTEGPGRGLTYRIGPSPSLSTTGE